MSKFATFSLLVCAAAVALTAASARAEPDEPAAAATKRTGAAKSGRLAINGVDYYYEVHGRGEPLLLLHGGLGSIEMFGAALPQLAKSRHVIAVDLHGHGRTALGERRVEARVDGRRHGRPS